MRPILKWAGGKTQVLPYLRPLFDQGTNYFEPFMGGGALYFDLQPERAHLNDLNAELIATYRAVRDEPHQVSDALSKHENTKDYFLMLRALDPNSLSGVEAAARFIFLNKTCFNGLYRVNKSNQFNVPFGNYKKPSIPDLAQLTAASRTLQKAELVSEDFRTFLLQRVSAGDQVYLDPPYVPSAKYSDFTRYTPGQFDLKDQEAVAAVARELRERGAMVVISNSNTEFVRELYSDFRLLEIPVRRSINIKGDGRKSTELVIVGEL